MRVFSFFREILLAVELGWTRGGTYWLVILRIKARATYMDVCRQGLTLVNKVKHVKLACILRKKNYTIE